MKKNMIMSSVAIFFLFSVLFLGVTYKNLKDAEGSPYGKSTLDPATIEQLDDPLYQNQILPDELEKKIDKKENVTTYFYSPKCLYCQNTTPIVVQITEELGINLMKLNLLEFKSAWDTFNIKSTPTLIHYENGEEVARSKGQLSESDFYNFFREDVLSEK